MPLPSAELQHAKSVANRVDFALSLYRVRFGDPIAWGDLAQMFGWSQATQSEIKTGKRPLRVHELLLIGMRLAVNVGWLAAGEEPRESHAPPVVPPVVKAPPFKGTPVPRNGTGQADEKTARRANRRTK